MLSIHGSNNVSTPFLRLCEENIREVSETSGEVNGDAAFTKALYILKRLAVAKRIYKEALRSGSKSARKPKFIVFAEDFNSLQNVAHYFYVGNAAVGDTDVCEHWGEYR